MWFLSIERESVCMCVCVCVVDLLSVIVALLEAADECGGAWLIAADRQYF